MANRRHYQEQPSMGRIVAVILALVILVTGVLCCGYASRTDEGWFKNGNLSTWHWGDAPDEKDPEDEDKPAEDEPKEDEGGMVITPEENTATVIQFDYAPLYMADGKASTNDFTITATVTPDYATNPQVDWSLSWDKESKDSWDDVYYYTDWYTDDEGDCIAATDSLTVTDFVTVTPASDGAPTATVTCVQSFGCPIILTCTARDGNGAEASCRLDYQATLKGIELGGGNSVVLKESGAYADVAWLIKLSSPYYTLRSDYTLIGKTADVLIDFNTINQDYDGPWFPYSASYRSDEQIFNYGEDELSWSSSIFDYNTTWSTFCDNYIINQPTNITENQKKANRDCARRLLNTLSDEGVLSTLPMFGITAYVRDNITGETFTATKEIYFGSLSQIPVYNVAVSNITVGPSSFVFMNV